MILCSWWLIGGRGCYNFRLILPIQTYQITIPQFQPSHLALIVLGLTEMLLIFKAYLSLLMLYLVSSPMEYSNLHLKSLQSIVLN